MTPISKTEGLLSLMRAHAVAAREESSLSRSAKSKTPSSSMARTNATALIELRVRAIGSDDPRRKDRAFRGFLEGCLLQLFDIDGLSDPKFQHLIDSVFAAVRDDKELGQAADRIAVALLSNREATWKDLRLAFGSLSGGTSKVED